MNIHEAENIIQRATRMWEELKNEFIQAIKEYFESQFEVPKFMWTPIEWDTRRNSQVMSRKPLLVRRMNM